MNHLKKFFPRAQIRDEAVTESDILCIQKNEQYLCIPKEDLSTREAALLALFLPAFEEQPTEKSEWYQILFDGKAPTEEGKYRVIQIRLKKYDRSLYYQWLEEIHQLSHSIVEVLALEENNILIIEKYTPGLLTAEELEGIFLALDTDFDYSSDLFVGTFCDAKSQFTTFFAEEQTLFHTCRQSNHQKKCLTLAKCVIAFYSNASVQKSYLLETLYHEWFGEENELTEIVSELWKNQGNISVTAKNLFMHRNTLFYKIDKFFERTQINLKEMDGLFLTYLLVVNFS